MLHSIRSFPRPYFRLHETELTDGRIGQNIVATYIGVAVYVVCYLGWWAYEYFWLKKRQHFVPLKEVDLDTDAVWPHGEGLRIRQEEQEAREKRDAQDLADGKRFRVWARQVSRYVG